ncbi:urea ABC transporter permease subunit UrtC [Rhodococcus sp. IEGM 1408]|uniref:urea ABC transporter permease subunit UrtC n=1 Tax=Rhodococcus sp. IEGM 1408 TaxID=3082220 RepID=UPI002953231F|nr:urea ABC transporter permease subunit UrtC [Rhodococcus sp. IEGM 1408]MDV8001471.1 urea ABC transporter permease subunit UrtC [Rhodococcus sp. IEGM 1408]
MTDTTSVARNAAARQDAAATSSSSSSGPARNGPAGSTTHAGTAPPRLARARRLLAGEGERPRWLFWAGLAVAAIVIFGLAPALLSDFRLSLLAKFFCYAIVASGIGLAWGRGGMLTLGQGVYFGVGAYAMAMFLKISDARDRGGPDALPDFMQIAGMRALPSYWEPFASPGFALAVILLVPPLLAFGFGYLVFNRKVKGAYFAILSQALAAAAAIFLVSRAELGGSNGLNRFTGFFGFALADPANRQMLYFLAGGALIGVVLLVRQLMNSRFGELLVAVRDQEERVRFLGYDPALVKSFAYAVAAFAAGLAGALFVPIVGIISPSAIGIAPSIAFLIGVAIGGRATLLGPVLGAIGVAWAQTAFSEAYPSQWTYLQGILFIVVVGFLPGGLASLFVLRRRHAKVQAETTTTTTTTSETTTSAATADPSEETR